MNARTGTMREEMMMGTTPGMTLEANTPAQHPKMNGMGMDGTMGETKK